MIAIKECPFCCETIKVNATECKHCGSKLNSEKVTEKATQTNDTSLDADYFKQPLILDERKKQKRKRPISLTIFAIYLIIQGISVLGTSPFVSGLCIAIAIGIFNAHKIAYWGALISFGIAFIWVTSNILLIDAPIEQKGPYIGVAFWCFLFTVYLLLPGIRRYFFNSTEI